MYSDAEDCLKELSGKYKIGVIANQSLGAEKRLKNFGLLKYIDLVIASTEEGIAKLDRRIFKIALNRANCEPGQSIMIGDWIDNDIVPAKKLGMRTIWIERGFGRYWNVACEVEKAAPSGFTKSLYFICTYATIIENLLRQISKGESDDTVALEQVSFSYVPTEKLLEDFNLSVKKG